MRYAGILLTLVIIAIWAVWTFAHIGGSDPQDSVDWWYDHPTERAERLKWCNDNPQNQNSPTCTVPIAAQIRADTEASQKQ
jgi:hypothetical protein